MVKYFLFLNLLGLCITGCINHSADPRNHPVSGIADNTDSNQKSKPAGDTIKGTCTIDLLNPHFESKEFACNRYLFQYKRQTVYADSNFDLTQYYYAVIDTLHSNLRLFDQYDSPTGRRKLLVLDIEGKQAFKSNWFDDSASGDSIDISSINLKAGIFTVHSKDHAGIGKAYIVKLNILPDRDRW